LVEGFINGSLKLSRVIEDAATAIAVAEEFCCRGSGRKIANVWQLDKDGEKMATVFHECERDGYGPDVLTKVSRLIEKLVGG
jgi:squalene cyclase